MDDASGRHVKVIIIAASSDPQLTALRSAIVAAGGSVYYRYQSVPGVSAMVPGNQILNIASRPDVDAERNRSYGRRRNWRRHRGRRAMTLAIRLADATVALSALPRTVTHYACLRPMRKKARRLNADLRRSAPRLWRTQ